MPLFRSNSKLDATYWHASRRATSTPSTSWEPWNRDSFRLVEALEGLEQLEIIGECAGLLEGKRCLEAAIEKARRMVRWAVELYLTPLFKLQCIIQYHVRKVIIVVGVT